MIYEEFPKIEKYEILPLVFMIGSKTQHKNWLSRQSKKGVILCINLDGKTLNKLLANLAIFLQVDDRNE